MPRRISCVRLTEEAGEQRYKGDADEGDTAAGHQLYHGELVVKGFLLIKPFIPHIIPVIPLILKRIDISDIL